MTTVILVLVFQFVVQADEISTLHLYVHVAV